jgi:hypothetical protein
MPKISQLPEAVTVNAADEFAIVQGGVTKRADAATLLDYIDDHVGGGSAPGPAPGAVPVDSLDLRNQVEPGRPADGYLRLFSLKHGSIGLPHFLLDDGYLESGYPPQTPMIPVIPLPGMHRFAMVPAGSSAPLQWGFPTLGTTGTVTARARWNGAADTDIYFYYPARVQAVSVTTVDTGASLRWASIGQGMLGGAALPNAAYRGGLYMARFRPILESDDRMFIGLMDRTTDPTATLDPSSTTFADNMIGIAKDAGDASYSLVAKRASGAMLKVPLSGFTLNYLKFSMCHLYILFAGESVRVHLSALGTGSDAHAYFSYRLTDNSYIPISNTDDELYPWFYVNNGSGVNTLSARVEYMGHSITDLAAAPSGEQPAAPVAYSPLVTSLTYTGKSFSVAAQTTTPRGLRFSADGLQMYVVAGAEASIFEYTLSTPWDVSTASYSGKSLSVSAQTGANPGGFEVSRYGEFFFVTSPTNAAVYRYDLSTPWDISTATYSGQSISVSAQDSSPRCCAISRVSSNNGMRLMVQGNTNQTIYQYNLASPWTLTGASYSGKSLSTAAVESAVTGMAPAGSPTDANAVFIIGQTTDRVHDCRDAFYIPGELDGMSWARQSPALTAQDALPVGMALDYFTQSHLFMLGDTNDAVYQYDIP